MKNFFPVAFFLLASAALGQEVGAVPGPDFQGLFTRVSESDYTLIGRVIKSDGVVDLAAQERNAQQLAATGKASLDGVFGGSLFTVQVETPLCAREDFMSKKTGSPRLGTTIQIFVPRDAPYYEGSYRKENLLVGQKYLLFLKAQSDPKLKERYALESTASYYRTYEASRGAVLLAEPKRSPRDATEPDFPAELVAKLKPLCEAVQSSDVASKIMKLERLKYSDDPVLAESASAAIEKLRMPPDQKQ